MKNNKNFKIGLLLLVFVLLIGGGIIIAKQSKANTTKGNKTITVEVIMADDTSKSYEINTDAEFLRGALDQENLIEGSESEYGFFVLTVDGYTANDDNQEWWALSKDGESLMTGVNDTPINDGDHFEITLTVGY
ncbi:MAG: DUF4430 domain-containing protein [Clostridiales bacterium]|nr:DUF4430 domain-containing protein [Clostridiales bacterium]